MNPTETKSTIFITIDKPIYGTYIAIRDKWLKRAEETKKTLTITFGDKKVTVTPKEWRRGAKRIKKIFLIPEKPMILYCNHLERFIKKEEPQWTEEGLKKLHNALKVSMRGR